MVFSQQLVRAGLTQNEARVYETLLATGSCKAGKLAKESELNRTSAYAALQSLLAKGLVSYVLIGKIRWFQASDPENLAQFLQTRLENLREILPQLRKRFRDRPLSTNVRLFKGTRGIKTVLQEIIREQKPNCVFGSEGQLAEKMPLFSDKFEQSLRHHHIPVRTIVRAQRPRTEVTHKNIRFIPMTKESPVVTNIFGNKIAIILWSDAPEAVLIENAHAADAYRAYFEFVWQNASKK